MPEWSALARHQTQLDMVRAWDAEHRSPDRRRWRPRPETVDFWPGPEPGTGRMTLRVSDPPWVDAIPPRTRREIPPHLLEPEYNIRWFGDDEGTERYWQCPLTHRAGALEWAARRRPREVLRWDDEMRRLTDPVQLPAAVNREPDPGSGVVEISLNPEAPIWVAVWHDQDMGLAEIDDDDLREVIKWAQSKPAAERVVRTPWNATMAPREISVGEVPLDEFLTFAEDYLNFEPPTVARGR
jgi:hypothetical protein